MTFEAFIATTQKVIAEQGLDAYLPTLILEDGKRIQVEVLQDVPEQVDIAVTAMAWAERVAKNRDFLLAFRVDASRFNAVHRSNGVLNERIITVK